MLRFDRYERPGSAEEAYELVQSEKFATVLGGMMWLRMASRTIPLAIDLSGAGLDQIEDTGDSWRIGAMVTLSQLENHPGFKANTAGIFTEGVRDIIGTQFRNLATVGGSVYARMGFSDIVCALLPLDASVECVGAGTMPLARFVEKGAPKDILSHVIVRKHDYRAAFAGIRNSATDFCALNTAAAQWDGAWHVAVGARPQKALLLETVPEGPDAADALADTAANVAFGSDRRASAEWRAAVAPELVRRALASAAGKERA